MRPFLLWRGSAADSSAAPQRTLCWGQPLSAVTYTEAGGAGCQRKGGTACNVTHSSPPSRDCMGVCPQNWPAKCTRLRALAPLPAFCSLPCLHDEHTCSSSERVRPSDIAWQHSHRGKGLQCGQCSPGARVSAQSVSKCRRCRAFHAHRQTQIQGVVAGRVHHAFSRRRSPACCSSGSTAAVVLAQPMIPSASKAGRVHHAFSRRRSPACCSSGSTAAVVLAQPMIPSASNNTR